MNPISRGVRALPQWTWAPLAGAFLVAVIGVIGWLAGYIWLFPSVGSTAYMQVAEPEHRSSRLYHTLMGHAIAIGAAYLFVAIFQTWLEPPVLAGGQLFARRVWASIAGMGLMLLVQVIVKALHAPAAATLLLITFGAFRAHWGDLFALAVGIGIVAFLGEVLRRLRAPDETERHQVRQSA